MKTKSKI